MEDEIYKVYVDATILGRHDPKAPKNAWVAYVVEGRNELRGVKEVDAEETDEAECEAVLFAIRELRDNLNKFTIFCDHQSVVSEAKQYSKDTPKTKQILREIRRELASSEPNIKLEEFLINPAHTYLNEFLLKRKTM